MSATCKVSIQVGGNRWACAGTGVTLTCARTDEHEQHLATLNRRTHAWYSAEHRAQVSAALLGLVRP